jgi:hypothetical protein
MLRIDIYPCQSDITGNLAGSGITLPKVPETPVLGYQAANSTFECPSKATKHFNPDCAGAPP